MGEIVLQNTGENELYFWELSFDTNVCIDSVWNARLSENLNEDFSCLVKACDDMAIIAPGDEVKIGFTATKSEEVQTMIENVSLSHTSVNGTVSDEEAEDKEESETDYYEKIAEVMQRYDESTYSLDTDGDSLSDFDEVYKTYTDSLVFDSAVSGCSDGEADSDGDGILNIEEVELDINPLSADTDEDALSDSEEINIHGTNPILIDTDGDGIEDKHELILGFDPLKMDSDDDGIEDGKTLFLQETEAVFENNAYVDKVHVSANATNLFTEVTTIKENTRCLNEDFEKVEVLGTPVEINTKSDIESAQISFYLKEGYNATDYVVLWFDEENSRFVECDTEYNEAERIVSANTSHFSIYFLVPKAKWGQLLEDYYNYEAYNFETVLVVDCSASMSISDSTYADFTFGLRTSTRRKDICEAFYRKVNDNNKQGVVFFNNNGTVLAKLGSTREQLEDTLGRICNGYNTNIKTALEVALDEVLSSADKNAVKSIVLVSDGGTEHSGDTLSYDKEVLERAKKENVRIYTVAVGNNAMTENLEEIANVTDGIAFTYYLNNSSSIVDTIFSHQIYQNYINVTPTVQIKEEDILGSEAYLESLNERVSQEMLGIMDYTYCFLCDTKVKIMMDDYYAYSKHSNPEDISDEMWDAYCDEFNKAIRGYGVYTADVHYFRNELNRAPATRDELIAEKEKWMLLPIEDSLYHMYGEEGLFNTKFISAGDGKYEGVYDKDGLLLTEENDSKNMGTYNYCGPSKDEGLHALLDVFPYYIWANVEGDWPKWFWRDKNDFYANQEAQDAYDKIKEEMEND